MNWDVKIHTMDRSQSFIILVTNEPTKESAEKVAKGWLKANHPHLILREIVVERSVISGTQ